MRPGERYGVVITKGILDTSGEPLLEPTAIYLAASKAPLVDEQGNPTVSVLAGDRETAQTLEVMRQLLAPLYAQVEGEGLDRDDVAMGFTWGVMTDTMANFDPGFNPDALGEDDVVSPIDACLGARAPAIPIPNTAALDADGTFPAAGTCFAGERSAQGDFDSYLAGLHGWPAATPITLPLTGPVDVDTIGPDDVQLWAISAGSAARVEDISVTLLTELADRCTGETRPGYALLITPGAELEVNTTYVAFATRDIQSAAGQDLVPAAALLMAMQPYDVIDAEGNSLVGSLSNAQAQSIAGLRMLVRPLVGVIEASTELTYADLASVFTWYTWTDTFVVFDPSTAEIPFPNAALTADGRINLPIGPETGDLQRAIFNELNTRAGFSLSAPGWIPLRGELDEESLTHDSVVLASVEGLSPSLLTDEHYRIDYRSELDHITYTPVRPFETRKQHVGIVTTSLLGANGHSVQPTPAFVFLRSEHALVNNAGESLVDVLDDQTAQGLEAARLAYRTLFIGASLIPGRNYRRSDIAMAWAYVTGESTRPLQELRAQTLYLLEGREALGVAPACVRLDNCSDDPYLELDIPADYVDPNDETKTVDMSNVETIHRAGEFATTLFLDFVSGEMVGVDEAIDLPAGVSVFLPRRVQSGGECAAPFDIALVVHGLGGERQEKGLNLSNELAAFPHCLATVTVDLLLHGGRMAGSEDLHPLTWNRESGAGFLSADIVRSKNHFLQSALDLVVLTQILKGSDGVSGLESLFSIYGDASLEGPLFTTNVALLASSLAGIVGTLFLAVEPEISTGVLSNTGGRMSTLLEESIFGEPILATLESMGVVPGTLTYLQTLAFVQWIADHADPFTFAPFIARNQLDVLKYDAGTDSFDVITSGDCETTADCGAGSVCRSVGEGGDARRQCVLVVPANEVLLQMSVDDTRVPNSSTQLLADTIGVSLDNTTFDDAPHSLLGVRDPESEFFAKGFCGRRQVAQWLSSGLAGDAELPASLNAQTCVANFGN